MSVTTTITEGAARVLDRSTSRRGFLARAAMVGSAVAVAGRTYLLKPGSAYAATCNCSGRSCDCGSLCCDGYTEFCCAIYGENRCPPGTVLAGWWKVDGSSYCNGQARYYMDCNDTCGSCGCGSTGVCSGTCSGANCQCRSCSNRKDGCTHFRYGNCNNQIACVGPIMCRVVTCSKPWELEPTCTTATRVDNATRNHHRPCLEEPTGPAVSIESASGVSGGYRIRGRVSAPGVADPHVLVHVDRIPIQSVSASGGRFDTVVRVGPGRHEICVYLASADGSPTSDCVSASRGV